MSKMNRFWLNALVLRLQGTPMAMSNLKETRDVLAFTRLIPAINGVTGASNSAALSANNLAIKRLPEFLLDMNENDLNVLQGELLADYPDLKKIFKYYANYIGPRGMTLSYKDWNNFCTDCKLLTGTNNMSMTLITALRERPTC